MRTIIVGDVHGCYNELMGLLDKVKLNEEKDRLVFLGDLIDRGNDPYLVIKKVQELENKMGDRCVMIRGNHEQFMLEALKPDKPIPDNQFAPYGVPFYPAWWINGGEATLKSFDARGKDIKDELPWLENTKLYFECEDFVAAHAGISNFGPEDTDRDTFLWDRDIAEGYPYDGKFFIFGHTPMLRPAYFTSNGKKGFLKEGQTYDLPKNGSLCLDTGCVFGNKITSMVIEDHKYRVVGVRSERERNLVKERDRRERGER